MRLSAEEVVIRGYLCSPFRMLIALSVQPGRKNAIRLAPRGELLSSGTFSIEGNGSCQKVKVV